MTNRDIKEVVVTLAQAVTTQINLSMIPKVNVMERTMTPRFRDFVRINTPIFLGSNVGEDNQKYLDGVYKVLSVMGITSMEKEELASYKLRDVS